MSSISFLLRCKFVSEVLDLTLKKDEVDDTGTSGANLHLNKNKMDNM